MEVYRAIIASQREAISTAVRRISMAEQANFDFAEGKDFDAVWHKPQ